mmetsp:Transcript_49905/g.78973  ORF Transcript_49905/g.78973 Transcript_49905/m.78973 type:complete len:714 (-) Transcript_49905:23-2164(-)
MARCVLFATLLIASSIGELSAVSSNEDAQSIAGVQKVIQMLSDMSAKAKQEKKDEEVAFAEFDTWCKSEIPALKNSIAESADAIEMLTAEIGQLTNEAKTLGEEISKLQTDVASYEAEKKAKEIQRVKDHKAFIEESTDYSESLDALDRAISVLMAKNHDIPGSASAVLLQLARGNTLPERAKSMVSAFIGMMGGDFMKDEPGMDYEAPEANAYEAQSGNVISLLKRLKDEFRSKLADCQKEEMNSKHAVDMIVTDLVDSIENAKSDIEEKTATKARKEEKAAMDKKELAETIEVKKADEKTLSEMEVQCKEKKLSFGEKQQLRAEEIEAIQQAIDILKSPEVLGSADKHLDLAQVKAGATALALLRAANQNEGINARVRDFIAAEGTRLHSKDLALLAQKIAADPFGKVKKLIGEMITRLLNEANEDAQHEGFCDTEMGKNKITRAKLTEDIDALQAAIEDGEATIMHLTSEMATLSKEVAELQGSMVESTKLRQKEKAANKATVEDAVAAQKAVAAATAILKDFYEKASMATGFVQIERPKMGTDEWDSLANPNYKGPVDKGLKTGASWGHTDGMQTFGKKYTGQQDEAGGVLAMLEVIASDFSNLEAETKASEAASQNSYDEFMVESKKSKAVKEKKIEMDTADKAAAKSKLSEDTTDLKGTQDQLLAADRYYEKLVPQCIDQGMTWQERVKARESEIASLKEALKILSS